jgi:hypothetical protein
MNNTGGKKFATGVNDTAVNFATAVAKNLSPVSMTQAVNFATGTVGVIDTCSKFASDVNDTSGK